MDMNMWLQKAVKAIDALPPFKKFELRNLFQGCEWEGLSKGDRITFGKFFKAEVLGGRVENVMFLDRAKNNHSKYQKIGEIQNEATHL